MKLFCLLSQGFAFRSLIGRLAKISHSKRTSLTQDKGDFDHRSTGWQITSRTLYVSNSSPKYHFFRTLTIISNFTIVSRFPKPSLNISYLYSIKSYVQKTAKIFAPKKGHFAAPHFALLKPLAHLVFIVSM